MFKPKYIMEKISWSMKRQSSRVDIKRENGAKNGNTMLFFLARLGVKTSVSDLVLWHFLQEFIIFRFHWPVTETC